MFTQDPDFFLSNFNIIGEGKVVPFLGFCSSIFIVFYIDSFFIFIVRRRRVAVLKFFVSVLVCPLSFYFFVSWILIITFVYVFFLRRDSKDISSV